MQKPGIVLLPNLITTGCLFSGFYSIILSIQGRWEMAASLILVAMVLDTLDGRVARMTNTTSDFGAQYDSMADLVSFGLAPALLAYQFALDDMGRWGMAAAFVYAVGAALRLARFNARIAVVDKRYFQGLPSPSAAALVATLIWLAVESGFPLSDPNWALSVSVSVALIAALAGLAMVSNFSYYSFKDLAFKQQPVLVLFAAIFVLLLVFQNPPLVIFLGFMGYLVSGPLLAVRRFRKRP